MGDITYLHTLSGLGAFDTFITKVNGERNTSIQILCDDKFLKRIGPDELDPFAATAGTRVKDSRPGKPAAHRAWSYLLPGELMRIDVCFG